MSKRTVHTCRAVLRTFSSALTTVNVAIAGYLGVLTVAGLRQPRRPIIDADRSSTRFVIMVPAHNEAAVIADGLASMFALRYDPSLYEVHVVADNCTDGTADVVRRCGWAVHERTDPFNPGKGPALNWLFERLDRNDFDFDVALVVDADTVLHPQFLGAMDDAFQRGATVAQGFYSVLAPEKSGSAAFRYAALACRHHLRPLGRNRIGASCGLYGNGMAFRRKLLRDRQWSGHLVEDAEFQLELLLEDGIRVRYVPSARLEAEMPDTVAAATGQNQRWERGRAELTKRYASRLARHALVGGRAPRTAYGDALVDLLVPPLSVVAVLQAVGFAGHAATALTSTTFRGRPEKKSTRRAIVALATLAVLGTHVMAALRAVSAPASVYRRLAEAPRMILWKADLWLGALRSSNEVTWRRTTRNVET